MVLVFIPIVVMILATTILFISEDPSSSLYAIVTLIDFVMIFLMVKTYLVYLKTSHELRDKEFVEEITMMVKKIHQNRDNFSKDELIVELEHINRMINEYNLLHKEIIVEPVDIQDFLNQTNKK